MYRSRLGASGERLGSSLETASKLSQARERLQGEDRCSNQSG
jgi:hypothetical protein